MRLLAKIKIKVISTEAASVHTKADVGNERQWHYTTCKKSGMSLCNYTYHNTRNFYDVYNQTSIIFVILANNEKSVKHACKCHKTDSITSSAHVTDDNRGQTDKT